MFVFQEAMFLRVDQYSIDNFLLRKNKKFLLGPSFYDAEKEERMMILDVVGERKTKN